MLQVTFLYKLTTGACPKSYGVNVARLAGLPDQVVNRATAFARQLEEQHEVQSMQKLSSAEQQRLQKICQAVEQNCISPKFHAQMT